MIKAVLQPLHRKTNPSCTLNQSTWGCGSAAIGQLFFQSRLFLRLIEMNYAIFEWKLTPAFPGTVFGLKGTSIQGHSWENMEDPSPFLIIPSQNSTDIPPASETAIHRLGTTCVLRWRQTFYTGHWRAATGQALGEQGKNKAFEPVWKWQFPGIPWFQPLLQFLPCGLMAFWIERWYLFWDLSYRWRNRYDRHVFGHKWASEITW